MYDVIGKMVNFCLKFWFDCLQARNVFTEIDTYMWCPPYNTH